MSSVDDVTIGAGSTSIITAAMWKILGGPVWLKNESDTIVVLIISGSDDYDLDPGEIVQVLPGQIVTGSAVGGSKLLQIIAGIRPMDESAAKAVATAAASIIAAAEPALGSGDDLWSVGKDDFTAVYASTGTLTLGTFPTPMGTPNDGDFAKVVVTRASGEQVTYLPVNNAMTLAGQVLAVTGTPFLNTDLDYDVFIWGPPKSYDASTNADQVVPLTQPRPQQDSPQQSASSLADGTTHKYFDVEQGERVTFRILDTPGVAGDNTYTIHTSQLNDTTAEGSADYQDRTDEYTPWAEITSAMIAAKPADGVIEIYGFQAKRFRITSVRANDGANSDGAYQYDAMWS